MLRLLNLDEEMREASNRSQNKDVSLISILGFLILIISSAANAADNWSFWSGSALSLEKEVSKNVPSSYNYVITSPLFKDPVEIKNRFPPKTDNYSNSFWNSGTQILNSFPVWKVDLDKSVSKKGYASSESEPEKSPVAALVRHELLTDSFEGAKRHSQQIINSSKQVDSADSQTYVTSAQIDNVERSQHISKINDSYKNKYQQSYEKESTALENELKVHNSLLPDLKRDETLKWDSEKNNLTVLTDYITNNIYSAFENTKKAENVTERPNSRTFISETQIGKQSENINEDIKFVTLDKSLSNDSSYNTINSFLVNKSNGNKDILYSNNHVAEDVDGIYDHSGWGSGSGSDERYTYEQLSDNSFDLGSGYFELEPETQVNRESFYDISSDSSIKNEEDENLAAEGFVLWTKPSQKEASERGNESNIISKKHNKNEEKTTTTRVTYKRDKLKEDEENVPLINSSLEENHWTVPLQNRVSAEISDDNQKKDKKLSSDDSRNNSSSVPMLFFLAPKSLGHSTVTTSETKDLVLQETTSAPIDKKVEEDGSSAVRGIGSQDEEEAAASKRLVRRLSRERKQGRGEALMTAMLKSLRDAAVEWTDLRPYRRLRELSPRKLFPKGS